MYSPDIAVAVRGTSYIGVIRLRCFDVKHSAWSFENAGIVNASVDSVMAWWLGSDRDDAMQTHLERMGVREFSSTETTTVGLRVRTLQWKDRWGREHHHHIEMRLTEAGIAERTGDRFVSVGSDVASHQRPGNQTTNVSCDYRTEFIPQLNGGTEVRAIHNHTTTGTAWLQQWFLRRVTLRSTTRLFMYEIDRCRAATTLSPGQAE